MTNHKLTVKECESYQRRNTDAYGTRYPYKGKYHDYGSPRPLGDPPDLPEGWVYVSIPTWGLHIRKVTDQDYTKDL